MAQRSNVNLFHIKGYEYEFYTSNVFQILVISNPFRSLDTSQCCYFSRQQTCDRKINTEMFLRQM